MILTQYPSVNKVLISLLESLQKILSEKLVGVYLDGSLVIGDYEEGISDIDLVVAIDSAINEQEFNNLKKMHDDLVVKCPEWDDRIEACYITAEALGKVRSETSQIVNISPGEPFHRLESSKEWLMNWYLTREKSLTLWGPDPKTIIEPISKEEFIQSVKNHVSSWGEWIKTFSRNSFAQSYAILAMCRALYVCKKGEQVSKKQAALWTKKELPEWSEVIDNALIWRNGPKHSPANEQTFPKTVEFVEYIRKLILAAGPGFEPR